MQRHETAIHGSNQHEGTASTTCESMQRYQIGGSALTNSHHEEVFQSGQLDQTRSSNIQLQHELDGHLRELTSPWWGPDFYNWIIYGGIAMANKVLKSAS